MEDQMGDFPTGLWGSKNIKRISPGRSKPKLLSRGVYKFIKFDFPALSTDIIQHWFISNPKMKYFYKSLTYMVMNDNGFLNILLLGASGLNGVASDQE